MNKRNHYYIQNDEIILRTWSIGFGSTMYWLYGVPFDHNVESNYRFKKITTAINFALKQTKNNKWNVSFETTLQLTKLISEVREDEDKYIILPE